MCSKILHFGALVDFIEETIYQSRTPKKPFGIEHAKPVKNH